ncbi:hypothetical protein ACR30L_03170 [Psychromonas sp. PT13]|uniref:hypothetical protein n=1 Tax=Psychromonas sp. PT13 TaxID=3439547 RepID=UPI003EB7C89D
MNTKKALKKLKQHQDKLQKTTLKKLKKHQKKVQSSVLKKLKKQQKKQQSKALKKLKKHHKKQQDKTRKQLKKRIDMSTAPTFKHTLKAVSEISTSSNAITNENKYGRTTQQNIIPIMNVNSHPRRQAKKKKLQKILRVPLKSRPCGGCPALSNGICKCAAKKFG